MRVVTKIKAVRKEQRGERKWERRGGSAEYPVAIGSGGEKKPRSGGSPLA
jgi:hypothetical protein